MSSSGKSLIFPDKSEASGLLRSVIALARRSNVVAGVVLVLLLLITGGVLINGFLQPGNLLTIATLGMLLTLAALGQTFVVISGSGGIDLSVGAVMSFSTVLGAMVIAGHDSHLWLGLIVVCAFGLGLGFVNGLGICLLRIPPLVMTLGMAGIVEGLAIVVTHGQPTGSSSPFLSLVGSGQVFGVPLVIVVGLGAAVVAECVLQRTGFGRMLFLVGSNRTAAKAARVSRSTIILGTYALAGALNAFAGLILLGYTQTPYLEGGQAYMLSSVAAVVVGGISLRGGQGSVGNAVLGAFVLTIISSILVGLHVAQGGREIIDGCILVMVLAIYALRGRQAVR